MSDKKNYKRGYCVFPETGQDVHDWEREQANKKTQTINWTNELEKETACLTVDIVNLKELLKECKHIMSIEKDFASCHFEKDRLCKILTKINQVLGEE